MSRVPQHRLIQLAAIDTGSLLAFMKVIALCSWYYNHDEPLEKPVRPKLLEWQKASLPFVTAFKLSTKHYNTMCRHLANGTYEDAMDDAILDIGARMKDIFVKLEKDFTIDKPLVELFRALGVYARTSSENSYKGIERLVQILGEHSLTPMFAPDVSKTKTKKSDLNQLSATVRKLTGKAGFTLTYEQALVLSKDPKKSALYKDYLMKKGVLRKDFRARFLSHMRQTKGHPIPIAQAERMVADLPIRFLPSGFVGLVGLDEKNNPALFTMEGKQINGMPSPEAVLTMNPTYDPKTDNGFVFRAFVPGFQEQPYAYTIDYLKAGRSAKFKKVEQLSGNLEKYQGRWEKDVKGSGDNKYVALVVLVCYETASRIGSLQNKNDGLTTLRVKNLRWVNGGFNLAYTGKSAVDQKHEFRATTPIQKIALKTLKALTEDKDRMDFLFTDDNGRRITDADVRTYLKKIGFPPGVSIHKFRHVRGTALAREILQSANYKPKSKSKQKEAEDWFKKNVAEKVANLLGHRSASGDSIWSTSVSAYIDPETTRAFFTDLKLRIPNWVPKGKAHASIAQVTYRRDSTASLGVVYHATAITPAFSILKNKEFRLSSAMGTDADKVHNNGKTFFLSVTRSKLGRFSKFENAVLVLNADWLQANNKMSPVDYWGRSFRVAQPTHNEMEERVVSSKPTLPLPNPVSKAVTAVHVFLDKSDYKDTTYVGKLRKLVIVCKQSKVAVHVYSDRQAFILQDTRRALPSADLLDMLRTGTAPEPSYPRGRMLDRTLTALKQLIHAKTYSGLGPLAKSWYSDLNRSFDYTAQELNRQISASLHNTKKDKTTQALSLLVNKAGGVIPLLRDSIIKFQPPS